MVLPLVAPGHLRRPEPQLVREHLGHGPDYQLIIRWYSDGYLRPSTFVSFKFDDIVWTSTSPSHVICKCLLQASGSSLVTYRFKWVQTPRQIAGTAKACYICYKPTTIVLATIHTVDFLYTCPSHLTDPGFASPIGDSAGGVQKLGLSAEEIAKVKEEWEAKQKKKLEMAKEKAKDGEKKDEGDGSKDTESPEPKSPKAPGSLSPSMPSPAAATHPRYALHRDFFASMWLESLGNPRTLTSSVVRLAEHRKRRQATQANELAPRLPGAPTGRLPDTV